MTSPFIPLGAEVKIVWLFDPAIFSFVRVATSLERCAGSRITAKRLSDKIIVGYAIHAKGAFGGGRQRRRFFYVERYDNIQNAGKPPCEAVDPLTVEAGAPGFKTRRCYAVSSDAQRDAIDEVFAQHERARDFRRASERKRNNRRKARGPRPPRRRAVR